VHHHHVLSTEQLVSSVKSVRTLYGGNTLSRFPASAEQVNKVNTSKVDSYLQDAITRANQLTMGCRLYQNYKNSQHL